MSFMLNLVIFLVLMGSVLLAYRRQTLWLRLIPYVILKCGKGRSSLVQLLMYGSTFVLWLLACHWLDVKGWHGLGAACMGFAMMLGLQAMRYMEEQQKCKSETFKK